MIFLKFCVSQDIAIIMMLRWSLKFPEVLFFIRNIMFTYHCEIWNFPKQVFVTILAHEVLEASWNSIYLVIFTHGQTMWFVITVNPKKHMIFHVDLENILQRYGHVVDIHYILLHTCMHICLIYYAIYIAAKWCYLVIT